MVVMPLSPAVTEAMTLLVDSGVAEAEDRGVSDAEREERPESELEPEFSMGLCSLLSSSVKRSLVVSQQLALGLLVSQHQLFDSHN